eukprot:TRINITY_DN3520_c2_g2_i1.p1 TRINITY_DN3520_c2_g2~~TRINITY_DN3520_c2_g2_i1.p1  ORF type:complete len:1155 (+),score=139.67 TRINITY_DN3520_c2_g2_i1:119-3466(+)
MASRIVIAWVCFHAVSSANAAGDPSEQKPLSNLESLSTVWDLEYTATTGKIQHMAFGGSGRYIGILSENGVFVIRTAWGWIQHKVPGAAPFVEKIEDLTGGKKASSIAIAQEGRRMFIGTENGEIRVYVLPTEITKNTKFIINTVLNTPQTTRMTWDGPVPMLPNVSHLSTTPSGDVVAASQSWRVSVIAVQQNDPSNPESDVVLHGPTIVDITDYFDDKNNVIAFVKGLSLNQGAMNLLVKLSDTTLRRYKIQRTATTVSSSAYCDTSLYTEGLDYIKENEGPPWTKMQSCFQTCENKFASNWPCTAVQPHSNGCIYWNSETCHTRGFSKGYHTDVDAILYNFVHVGPAYVHPNTVDYPFFTSTSNKNPCSESRYCSTVPTPVAQRIQLSPFTPLRSNYFEHGYYIITQDMQTDSVYIGQTAPPRTTSLRSARGRLNTLAATGVYRKPYIIGVSSSGNGLVNISTYLVDDKMDIGILDASNIVDTKTVAVRILADNTRRIDDSGESVQKIDSNDDDEKILCRIADICSDPSRCSVTWSFDEPETCSNSTDSLVCGSEVQNRNNRNSVPTHFYCVDEPIVIPAWQSCWAVEGSKNTDLSRLCTEGTTCKKLSPTESAVCVPDSDTHDSPDISATPDGTSVLFKFNGKIILFSRGDSNTGDVAHTVSGPPCPMHGGSNWLHGYDCINGIRCFAEGCCSKNSGLLRCPAENPVMCKSTSCAGGKEHCCGRTCPEIPCDFQSRFTNGNDFTIPTTPSCPVGRHPVTSVGACTAAAYYLNLPLVLPNATTGFCLFMENQLVFTEDPPTMSNPAVCNMNPYIMMGIQGDCGAMGYQEVPTMSRCQESAKFFGLLWGGEVVENHNNNNNNNNNNDEVTITPEKCFKLASNRTAYWGDNGGSMTGQIPASNFFKICSAYRYDPPPPVPTSVPTLHVFYPTGSVYAALFASIGFCMLTFGLYLYRAKVNDRRRTEPQQGEPLLEEEMVDLYRKRYDALLEEMKVQLSPDATISQCSVCLEDLVDDTCVELPNCGHRLHHACMASYITYLIEKRRRKHPTCPNCRAKLTDRNLDLDYDTESDDGQPQAQPPQVQDQVQAQPLQEESGDMDVDEGDGDSYVEFAS